MLSFGLGALLLCVLVSGVAYFAVRRTLVNQSVSAAITSARANAVQIGQLQSQGGLAATSGYPTAIEDFLSNVDATSGPLIDPCPVAASVLESNGIFVSDDIVMFESPNGVPESGNFNPVQNYDLWRVVSAGRDNGAQQIVSLPACGTYVLVGYTVPMLPGQAHPLRYFSFSSTRPVEHILHLLLVALVIASAVTVAAGVILGRWGAGRVLRPLRSMAEVASAIADGRLDSRIDESGSGDLAVLSSSFNRMVERLQQRIEHDARFASDVSHELRSPLTTLKTALSVIESRRDELPDRARQALDLLSAEVDRFQAMVRDLLEMSRLDAGSVDFQMSRVEVGELVRNALAPSAPSELPIEVDPQLEHRHLSADKRRVERVMTNLVDNAARHGGGAVRVTVEPAEGEVGELVRIAVEDEGPGVAEPERERIFERFARGSIVAGRRGRGGGSGLGLALVAEHVRLHGGRVWVEDRVGGGARFVVELPLAEEVVDGNGPEPE